MVDPTDLVGPVIGALAGGKVAEKVMGPTADLLGTQLRDLTERGQRNTGRVLSVAFRRLRADQDDGQVPPKVMKEFVDQAPWTEDELAAEYLGGVLASSRTERGRDDRAASLLALIGRLSTYEVRAHYVFYRALHRLLQGVEVNLALSSDREFKARCVLDFYDFIRALELDDAELNQVRSIIPHVMNGLVSEGLLQDDFGHGPSDQLGGHSRGHKLPDGHVLVFVPSVLGVELYCNALNLPGVPLDIFTSSNPGDVQVEGVVEVPSAQLVTSLPSA